MQEGSSQGAGDAEPYTTGMCPLPSPGHSLRVQVIICQLQLVIVAKAAQDGPGGLVPAPLDEEGVEEEETCRRDWELSHSEISSGSGIHFSAMLFLGKQTTGTERSSSHRRLFLTRGTNLAWNESQEAQAKDRASWDVGSPIP